MVDDKPDEKDESRDENEVHSERNKRRVNVDHFSGPNADGNPLARAHAGRGKQSASNA